jgi:heptaprenyl diphosphate synthase
MQYPADGSAARASALTAMLVALAIVLGFIESSILPSVAVPGVKLGLANLAVIVAFVHVGPARAAFVSLCRIVLVAVATGTFAGPVFWLSASGAIASFLMMWLLVSRGPVFSPVGWSVAGAAAHVSAQLAMAAVIASTPAPLALAPLSLTMSLPAGLALGFLARIVLSRLPELSLSVAGR